ncbi:MAG: hypothetical protein RL169_1426, partial [Armatimonadota bacterium]
MLKKEKPLLAETNRGSIHAIPLRLAA